MIYKDLCGEKVSSLGMGTMRFPRVGGRGSDVSIEKTAEMVEYALKNGVNYFDTAWGYHGGKSEEIVGGLLSEYPRESYLLATKFPGYSKENYFKKEEIFEEQLRRCRVEYFDFYLFHNVADSNIDLYLDPELGLYDYLVKQKKEGRIKHLGFSSHGSYETVRRFLDAYGDAVEFCQLQINWLDWSLQDAKSRVELLRERGIPVFVMEPVRGGKLVNLPETAIEKLASVAPDRSLAQWAFRYIQSLDGIGVTLSGMSNMSQLEENIRIFEKEAPLQEQEVELLYSVAESLKNCTPCTACGYCLSECPQKLDIPHLMGLYNEIVYTDGKHLPDGLKEDGLILPSECIACRSCEGVCPQEIKISEVFKDFTERLK